MEPIGIDNPPQQPSLMERVATIEDQIRAVQQSLIDLNNETGGIQQAIAALVAAIDKRCKKLKPSNDDGDDE